MVYCPLRMNSSRSKLLVAQTSVCGGPMLCPGRRRQPRSISNQDWHARQDQLEIHRLKSVPLKPTLWEQISNLKFQISNHESPLSRHSLHRSRTPRVKRRRILEHLLAIGSKHKALCDQPVE